MQLTEKGIEKVNDWLEQEKINTPYCTYCSNKMILQNNLIDTIDTQITFNGLTGHSVMQPTLRCLFRCEMCDYNDFIPIEKLQLELNIHYKVS